MHYLPASICWNESGEGIRGFVVTGKAVGSRRGRRGTVVITCYICGRGGNGGGHVVAVSAGIVEG